MLARARLAVFVAGLAIAWLVFDRAALAPAWLLPPLAAFAALVLLHLRVDDARRRARVAVALYQDGLARLENRWPGRGASGVELEEAGHLYAGDLDLLGAGSLFERLARVGTRAGAATLARWLLRPAAPAEIPDRQAAVRDLAPRLDFREDLAVAAVERGTSIDTDRLAAWGDSAAATGPSGGAAIAAVVGSALTLAGIVAGLVLDWGTTPFLAAVLFQAAVELSQRRRVAAALAGIDRAGRDLDRLARLLARIEREPFAAARLRALVGDLAGGDRPASHAIGALRRRIELLDSGRNFFFAPIAIWLSWRLHLARAIGAWRTRCGPRIAGWLAAVGEIEALDALAAYAFERPDDTYPEIVASGPPLFEAEGIAHPLLPAESRVRNDVRLGDGVRVLVVSGSNMSGKSTLLRAIGTNAVLALAGAPVCAERMRLSGLSIGASIRVADSLLEGSSRFQAEIERLKRIVDLAALRPALFLLDEVLHGTNSHDRRIGAEAVVRALLARGAIGLVTTHDLALAEIAVPGSPLANVHFVDHLENGRMRFDYRMHPGVVARSNALELMRAVGLDVEPPPG